MAYAGVSGAASLDPAEMDEEIEAALYGHPEEAPYGSQSFYGEYGDPMDEDTAHVDPEEALEEVPGAEHAVPETEFIGLMSEIDEFNRLKDMSVIDMLEIEDMPNASENPWRHVGADMLPTMVEKGASVYKQTNALPFPLPEGAKEAAGEIDVSEYIDGSYSKCTVLRFWDVIERTRPCLFRFRTTLLSSVFIYRNKDRPDVLWFQVGDHVGDTNNLLGYMQKTTENSGGKGPHRWTYYCIVIRMPDLVFSSRQNFPPPAFAKRADTLAVVMCYLRPDMILCYYPAWKDHAKVHGRVYAKLERTQSANLGLLGFFHKHVGRSTDNAADKATYRRFRILVYPLELAVGLEYIKLKRYTWPVLYSTLCLPIAKTPKAARNLYCLTDETIEVKRAT